MGNAKLHMKWAFLDYVLNLNFAEGADAFKKLTPRMEATHVMEVAQLLLSLIHSWGLDLHLDKVCETQLGLLRPMVGFSLPKFQSIHEHTEPEFLLLFLDSRLVWCPIKRRLYVTIASHLAK